MVTTLQGAAQVSSPVIENLTENVTVKQPVIYEQTVQSREIQQNKQKSADINKVDYTKLQDKLQEILNEENLYIKFDRDKDTDKMIFKLIDNKTKEVVQQIPPEISLKIARYIAVMYDNVNITNFKA